MRLFDNKLCIGYYRLWQFKNLSEIGRSRYCLQPLGLRFILGYDENRIFLTFLKPIVFGNLRFMEKKIW